MNLTGATNGATFSDSQGLGTINNDDVAAVAGSISINDVTITEGNSGIAQATFTVTRTGGTAGFTVNYASADGTATVANGDYGATSGTLSFGAGVNAMTFSVPVNGDTAVEGNETFYVNLTGATNGATLSDSQGLGTINNDDAAGGTGDRFEDNDTAATPTNLGTINGAFTAGALSMEAGDADWYRFTLPGTGLTGDAVTASFTHSLGDVDMALYDSTGTAWLRIAQGSENEEEISLAGLAPGSYLVKVYGFGTASNPNYSLSVSAAPQTGVAGLIVAGTSTANYLLGAGGPDTVSGLAGNDVLIGLAGNDSLDGGAGLDTAVYANSRAGFTVTKTLTGLSVSGPEGADTLSGIERLHFADVTLAFDIDGNAGQTYRLYQAAFNRTPDQGGLGYWIDLMDHGVSLPQVASGFMNSPEFQGLYGANPTNGALVTLLYNNVLHRAPDQNGYNYWIDLLTHGTTREQVLIGFSESDENKTVLLPAMQNGMAFVEPYRFTGSPAADVLIGTASADTLSGLAGDDVLIGLAGNDSIDGGAGIDTSVYSGNRATHTVTRVGSSLTVAHPSGADGTDTLVNVERLQFADFNLAFDVNGNAGQTYRLYQAAFNRIPDQEGLGYWINGMDHGMTLLEVAQGFIGSAEFQGLYGARPTNGQLVNLLYSNVLHRAPDQGGYDYWVYQLEHGMTREQALTGFSESPENQAALIGVIQDGMAYIPV